MMTFKRMLPSLALFFAVFFLGIGAGVALAAQSHMLNARAYLNDALLQLNLAVPDKGGHRVQAMNLVKSAISQVNLGIAAGAR